MAYVLLVLHIATAVIFIGGVTVAASVFPRYATAKAAAPYADVGGHPVAREMHRITKVYGRLAVTTPVLGFVLAVILDRTSEAWVVTAIVLVFVAGLMLVAKIIPMQAQMLRNPPTDPKARAHAMAYAGTLNFIWLAVLVLMITKPGGAG